MAATVSTQDTSDQVRSGSSPVRSGGGLVEVDAPTLRRWLDERRALLVDVREADEHARERIPEARLVPLSRFDPAAAAMSSGEAEGERVLVLHCRSGRRSAEAAQRLLAAGRGQAWHLAGGIEAWKAAGFDVSVDRAAPLPIMRQVQIVAGSLVLLGVGLGALVSPWFLIVCGFVGGGLLLAGASGWCGMALLLEKLPWNRRASGGCA